MAVRLPGAPDLAAFWRMVETGARGIEHFPAPDGLVGARSQMDGLLAFDPDRFGISRQEARLMDPQQRHLLMACVQALAHAGIADPQALRVGLVAGAGENTYFQAMLRETGPDRLPDPFQLALHHDKDFLTTKAAYHLGLTGPAFSTQAACSSSLVAVHVAAGLLRQDDADVMLAGESWSTPDSATATATSPSTSSPPTATAGPSATTPPARSAPAASASWCSSRCDGPWPTATPSTRSSPVRHSPTTARPR